MEKKFYLFFFLLLVFTVFVIVFFFFNSNYSFSQENFHIKANDFEGVQSPVTYEVFNPQDLNIKRTAIPKGFQLNYQDIECNVTLSKNSIITYKPYLDGVEWTNELTMVSLSATPEIADTYYDVTCNKELIKQGDNLIIRKGDYDFELGFETLTREYSEPIIDEKTGDIISYDVKPQAYSLDYIISKDLKNTVVNLDFQDKYKTELSPTLKLTLGDIVLLDPTYRVIDTSTDSFDVNTICEGGGTYCHLLPNMSEVVLYYPFDVDEGVTFRDWSSNDFDGDGLSGVTYTSSGWKNGGIDFPGGYTDEMHIETNVTDVPFTVCMWIKTDFSGGDDTIFSMGNKSTTSESYTIRVRYNPYNYTQIYTYSDLYSFDVSTTPTNSLSPNVWQHICGVWTSNTSRMACINGVCESPNTALNVMKEADRTSFGGAVFVNYAFLGQMDEIIILNRGLNSSEVNQLYQSSYNKFYPEGNQTINLHLLPKPIGYYTNNSGFASVDGTRGLDINGSYAYVGSYTDDRISIFDISNNTPIAVGSYFSDSGFASLDGVRDVFVRGDYLFTGSYSDDTLGIYDISNNTPIPVGSYFNNSGDYSVDGLYGLHLQGDYVYTVSYVDGTLGIFDISNNTPIPVGGYTNIIGGAYSLSGASDVYLQGNYAYTLASFDGTLSIFDISNNTPIPVGYYSDIVGEYSMDNGIGLIVKGDYAYVTSQADSYFSIFDISNNTPLPVSSIPTANPYKVEIVDDFAYVTNYLVGGLSIYNITNRSNPFLTGFYQDINGEFPITQIFDVKGVGSKIYTSSIGANAFSIFDNADSLGYDRVNVTTQLTSQMANLTNLTLGIYDGISWTNFQPVENNTLLTFNITNGATQINLTYRYIPDNNNQWSTILFGETLVKVWSIDGDVPSDSETPTFSSPQDNNNTLTGNGIVRLNMTVTSTNSTVWVTFNGTNTYVATNFSATSSIYNVSFPWNQSGTFPYIWYALGNGSDNLQGNSPTYYYTINASPPPTDDEYPLFSNHLQRPANNSQYNNLPVIVNVTIIRTNGNAGLEFNGVNKTKMNVSSMFNASVTGLSAGTYSYYWWAYGNGTSNNYNVSNKQYYTIAKNSTLNLGITGTTPITYGTVTDVAGSSCPSQLSCTLSPSNAVYGAGSKLFNYSTAGNNNFTATSKTINITINKATPVLTFLANGGTSNLTLVYPQQVNISARTTGGSIILQRNGVNDTINNGRNVTLGVGQYIYKANITTNQNYTALGNRFYNITITKATGGVYAWVNNSRTNYTSNNNTAQNIWLNGTLFNGTGIVEMWLNGSRINNGTAPRSNQTNLKSGYYNFTVVYIGNQNYTSSRRWLWINITPVLPDAERPQFTNFKEDRNNATKYSFGYTYGFNVTITSTNGSAGIDFNGVNYSISNVSTLFNKTINDLPAGTFQYYYWAYGNGSSHLYNSSSLRYYTINKTAPVGSLEINGVWDREWNGSTSTITLSETNNGDDDIVYEIYVNTFNEGTSFTTGDAGKYFTYLDVTIAGQNYTIATMDYKVLNISRTPGEVYAWIDNARNNYTANNNTAQNIWLNATMFNGTGIVELWLNGSIINNGTAPKNNQSNLSIGYYNFTAVYIGGTNQTADREWYWINVTEASAIDTSNPWFTSIENREIVYGINYSQDIDASDDQAVDGYFINDSRFSINIDDGLTANISSLPTGLIYLNVSVNDTSNKWNSTIIYINVSQATQTATINVNETSPIVYGTNINITCNGELFANDINYTDQIADSITLAVDTWNFQCRLDADQNHSFDDDNSTLTVTQASGTIALLLNGTAGNLLLKYPSQVNASTTSTTGTVTLLRDGTDITAQNHLFQNLAVGYYNFTATVPSSQNYTASTISRFANITQASQSATLSFNETSPVSFGTSINVSCNGELYRDGVNITGEIADTIFLGAGSWAYSCQLYSSQNYSYDDDNATFVVNQLVGEVYAWVNNSRSNYLSDNNTAVSLILNGTLNTGVGDIELRLNGSSIMTGNSPLVNYTNLTGYFNLTAVYSGNQNYTGDRETWWINVTLVIPDFTAPWFTNVINHTILVNESFSYDINAEDNIRVNCFIINDTRKFNINCSGYMQNISALNITEFIWFNVSVNDTTNNQNSTIFYINITSFLDFYPNITVYFPINATIESSRVDFNITCWDADNISAYWYSLNGASNITLNLTSPNTTFTGLSWEAPHYLHAYCNDTNNNVNSSLIWFYIGEDTTEAHYYYLYVFLFVVSIILLYIGYSNEDYIINILASFVLIAWALAIWNLGYPGLNDLFLKRSTFIIVLMAAAYLLITNALKFMEENLG